MGEVIRDKNGRVIKGTPNPNGRPLGQRNFSTIYREALQKLADLNEITLEELEDSIAGVAIKKARAGDFRFWKELHDRLYGTATQRIQTIEDENPLDEKRKEEIINATTKWRKK